MASSFDPFDLDKPVLRLGDFGTFALGDITESRRKRLAEIGELMGDMDAEEQSDAMTFVRLVGDLAEAACEDAAGMSGRIVELYESEQIGMKALQGLAEFVHDWVVGQETVGEG